MCISVCPTGALKERCFNTKDIPAKMESNETVCEFCSVGCKIDVQTSGNLVMKADAIDGSEAGMGLACGRNKFGFCRLRFLNRRKNQNKDNDLQAIGEFTFCFHCFLRFYPRLQLNF